MIGIAALSGANIWRVRRMLESQKLYSLPSADAIEQANSRLYETRVIWSVVKDVVLSLLFTVLVLFLAHGFVSDDAFAVNRAMRASLMAESSQCVEDAHTAIDDVRRSGGSRDVRPSRFLRTRYFCRLIALLRFTRLICFHD